MGLLSMKSEHMDIGCWASKLVFLSSSSLSTMTPLLTILSDSYWMICLM